MKTSAHSAAMGLACLIALTGCAGPDSDPAAEPPVAQAPASGDLRGDDTPRGADDPVRFDLDPVSGSVVAGSVWVHPHGEQTRIVVEAQALRPGSVYAARMHTGNCGDPGPAGTDLGTLEPGGAPGRANSESVVPMSAGEITSGPHVVEVFLSGETGSVVACASLAPIVDSL